MNNQHDLYMERILNILVELHRTRYIVGKAHEMKNENLWWMLHLRISEQLNDTSTLFAQVLCAVVHYFAMEIGIQTLFEGEGSRRGVIGVSQLRVDENETMTLLG